jgi:hypothetical protein
MGPGNCPRVWYDAEALGRIAEACPDTSRLVDIALEEGSGVYLGSSSSSGSSESGGGGGDGLGLRPPRPRRQTSALLSDAGAMDEVCRKLGRGLPLAAGLSSGELSKYVCTVCVYALLVGGQEGGRVHTHTHTLTPHSTTPP